MNRKVYSHDKHGRGKVQKNDGCSLSQVSVSLRGEVCYLVFLTCAMPGNKWARGMSQKLKFWQDHCARNYEKDRSPFF